MYETLDCVALRLVRHNDRHDILTAYSRQRGRVSFVLSAGRGREAMRRRALLMPMSRFECVASMRPGQDLATMRDVRPLVTPAADSDPVRGIIAMFTGDLLCSVLTEPMSDGLMYAFVAESVDALATTPHRRLTNLHLAFMVRLMRFLGIEPDDGTYTPGMLFDMTDGVFRPTPPTAGKYLDRAESAAAYRLLRISYGTMHRYRFTRAERNTVVDRLIEYYTMHHHSTMSLRSLDILRSL